MSVAMRWRPAPPALVVIGVLLTGVVGAFLGMLLLGRTTVPMGPFRVELQAGFGKGQTVLDLPPFGSLTADTHLAPFELAATLQDVGVERLTDVVNERGLDGLAADVERDARAQLERLALRALLAGAAGALVLGVLVYRSVWRLVASCVLTAIIAIGGSEVLALATFRTAGFTEPTYSGTLALAPKLIGPVQDATDKIDDLRAGLEQIVNGTVRAYTSLQTSPVGGNVISLLHISDLHASPLGVEFAREVARGFDVDMVVDTGDITSFATPVENLIVSQIPSFGRPYLFARGSHDSLALQAQIGLTSNGIVLDGGAREVAGLTVFGLGHPAFTPARGVPVDGDAFAELARSAGEEIAADLDRIERPVDVIAVHDDRMAEAVAGRVPVVISGHFHETRARVVNGTLFLRIATTGGSGAGIFRGLDVPFTAEVLYFTMEDDPQLLAYDVVEQQPDSGSLTVQRITIADEYGELTLTPTPTPTPTPSVTPTASPLPTPPASPTAEATATP